MLAIRNLLHEAGRGELNNSGRRKTWGAWVIMWSGYLFLHFNKARYFGVWISIVTCNTCIPRECSCSPKTAISQRQATEEKLRFPSSFKIPLPRCIPPACFVFPWCMRLDCHVIICVRHVCAYGDVTTYKGDQEGCRGTSTNKLHAGNIRLF